MPGFCDTVEQSWPAGRVMCRDLNRARKANAPVCATACCNKAPEVMLPTGCKVCQDCACTFFQGLLQVASEVRAFHADLQEFLRANPQPES